MMDVKFIISEIYIKQFRPPSFDDALKIIKERSSMLEDLFFKFENIILSGIEKYSGYNWDDISKNIIYVYPILTKGKSFSDPLTISLKENKWLNLIILIHELTHNILEFNIEPHDYQEFLINEIVRHIVIDIDEEDGLNAFEEFSNFFEGNFEKLNLKKINIKTLLNK